ncbi:MAG TPA: hypothetical protein ENK06_09640 [Gammaproteobacteria bacterium]|nr:hypothetical protein [Gammaproteobacteria bacterium]
MEINWLNFLAFGPFSERKLVFDQSDKLQVVYGPNEAGKSSALRGLSAFLYGIDVRSTDNFVHAHNKLRIEGCLRAANGQALAFARRKGQKNTLLSLSGEPLDDKVLAPFLQGVSLTLFEMLFGIDHQALVQGGQEILQQKGEVGQALFSASLGSHALQAVLNQLSEEADELFRPRGSTQTINLALKTYAELSKKLRDQSLSSSEWDARCRSLEKTTKALEQVQSELAKNRADVNRLKRIQRILPKLAQRRELLKKRQSMGDVVVLADDFSTRHKKTILERDTALAILQKASHRLKESQAKLEGLSVRQDILEQREIIEALHARLGEYRKAVLERPQLAAESRLLLKDAESLLKDMRPDIRLADLEVLRPAFAKKERITELGNQYSVLNLRVAQAKKRLQETQARLAEAVKAYQQFPAQAGIDARLSDALQQNIVSARKLGDLDGMIQSTRAELANLQTQCEAQLARLALWEGVLEDAPAIPLPSQETVARFEEVYDGIDKRTQRLREKQDEISHVWQMARQRLDELQRAGTVPTEEELIAVRTERDEAWQLLRCHWLEGKDVPLEARAIDTQRKLTEIYENRVSCADELSDRLRREADRVHKMASLLAEQGAAKHRADDILQQLADCATEKKQIDAEWKALWACCDIQPRTPREMRVWLSDFERLCRQLAQLQTFRQRLGDLEKTRDQQITQLQKALQGLGRRCPDVRSIDVILLESEKIAGEIEEINQQRTRLADKIKRLEHELQSDQMESERANNDFNEWKTRWEKVIAAIGLQADALPAEAAAVIDMLGELFKKQGEAEKLQIRIQAIDEEAASLNEQVFAVVRNVAPEFSELSVVEAVTKLNTLLVDSQTTLSRYQQIEEQLQQAQQDVYDAEAIIQIMTARLDALCVEAKRQAYDELEEAERRSEEYLSLKIAIDQVEQALLEAGEGVSLAALEMEAENIEADVLPGQIVALNNRIDQVLEPQRTGLAESKGREEKEMELMDGSDQAAVLAGQSQFVLAGIKTDVEHYVRLKLASRILRDEIDRYRKENQGPMVKRASEHFALLTQNSFARLVTDFSDTDEPVLAGVRPNGERVQVAGMSSGTRDQLYLALRLAGLEKYMESAEPMPFIVDDILVHFDDNRSSATLAVLAELAKKTQVILFTHHARLVDQARDIAVVHEL